MLLNKDNKFSLDHQNFDEQFYESNFTKKVNEHYKEKNNKEGMKDRDSRDLPRRNRVFILNLKIFFKKNYFLLKVKKNLKGFKIFNLILVKIILSVFLNFMFNVKKSIKILGPKTPTTFAF